MVPKDSQTLPFFVEIIENFPDSIRFSDEI